MSDQDHWKVETEKAFSKLEKGTASLVMRALLTFQSLNVGFSLSLLILLGYFLTREDKQPGIIMASIIFPLIALFLIGTLSVSRPLVRALSRGINDASPPSWIWEVRWMTFALPMLVIICL